MEEHREDILSFLTKKCIFKAPFVQRSYEWPNKRFEFLLTCINEIILNDLVYGHHDLQQILIEQNKDKSIGKNGLLVIKVWDGLQRIVSVYIILLAISLLLKEKGDDYYVDIINDYLVNPSENDEWYYKLQLSDNISKPIISLLNSCLHDIPINTKWDNTVVLNNYRLAYKYLKDYTVEELKEFVNKTDQLSVMWKVGDETDDMNKQFRLVNSQNDGISDYHYIKSCLLDGKSDEEIPLKIKNYFKDMENLLYDESAKTKRYKTIKLERFLKLVLHFHPDLKKDFRSLGWVTVFEKEIKVCEDKEKLIEDIYNYFKYYKLTIGLDSKNKKVSDKINEFKMMDCDLEKLFFGFSMDYSNKIISEDEYVELIDCCENIILRSHCYGNKSQTKGFLNKLWNNNNRNVIDKTDYVNSFKRILLHPKTKSQVHFINNHRFKEKFLEHKWVISGTGSGVFYFVENIIQNQKGDKKHQNILDFGKSQHGKYRHSGDHIFPQRPQKQDTDSLKGGLTELNKINEKWLNTIGNLVPTKYNSEMKNKSFREKCTMEKGYLADDLEATKKLLSYDVEVWGIDEIKDFAEWKFNIILEKFPFVSVDDSLKNYRTVMSDKTTSMEGK